MKATKLVDRMQTVVWEYDTLCGHCMCDIAKNSVAVVVDADTDTESVYHSQCAVEMVTAQTTRRGNLSIVK